MLIKDVMRQPYVIESDIGLDQAAKIMSDKKIGCLVMVKGSKIRGIITERDLLKNFSKHDKISRVMSQSVITIEPKQTLQEAYELMKENSIKRIPVINDQRDIVGIITLTDLAAHMDEFDESFFFNE
jgi:CBS domain-containing protein